MDFFCQYTMLITKEGTLKRQDHPKVILALEKCVAAGCFFLINKMNVSYNQCFGSLKDKLFILQDRIAKK